MRVPAVRPVVILLALSVLLSVTSLRTVAEEPPVTDATPTNRSNLPKEFCTDAEIDTGDHDITERPANGALVKPAATPGRDLYLLEITMPSGSCVGFGSHYLHDGAIVWFVQSGEIEFATQPIAGLPSANVTAGNAAGLPITISAMPTTLKAGDWLGLDRAAEYSYRNAGADPAVVLMAVNEVDPFAGAVASCKGGCRKR